MQLWEVKVLQVKKPPEMPCALPKRVEDRDIVCPEGDPRIYKLLASYPGEAQ